MAIIKLKSAVLDIRRPVRCISRFNCRYNTPAWAAPALILLVYVRTLQLQRRERTAQDVHHPLCSGGEAKHEVWADYYAVVLLDEETAAFFAARLPEAKARAAGGESVSPPSKKRKQRAADSAG